MTDAELLDRFANTSLDAILKGRWAGGSGFEEQFTEAIARAAYKQAKAMLVERAKMVDQHSSSTLMVLASQLRKLVEADAVLEKSAMSVSGRHRTLLDDIARLISDAERPALPGR